MVAFMMAPAASDMPLPVSMSAEVGAAVDERLRAVGRDRFEVRAAAAGACRGMRRMPPESKSVARVATSSVRSSAGPGMFMPTAMRAPLRDKTWQPTQVEPDCAAV